MVEYGYCHVDPEVGKFFSRLTLNELKHADSQRGNQVAGILNQYQDNKRYNDFLSTYTPVIDPFIHEARVHLFRRDQHMRWINKQPDNDQWQRYHSTVVYQENRIMDRYFYNTLMNSNYVFSSEKIDTLKKRFDRNELRDSWVSRHLITRFSYNQMQAFLLLMIAFVLVAHRYFEKKSCAS